MLAITSNTSVPLAFWLILVVVFITNLMLSLQTNALRMINLDAPANAFQGETIILSCHYSLGIERGNHVLTSTRQTDTNKHDKIKKSDHLFSLDDNFIEKVVTNSTDIDKNDNNNYKPGRLRLNSNNNNNNVITVEQLYAIKWYKDDKEFFRYLSQDWPNKQYLPLDGVLVDVDKSNNYTVTLKNVTLKTSGLFGCEVSTDAPNFITKSIERKMSIYSMPNFGPKIEIETLKLNNFESNPYNSQSASLETTTTDSNSQEGVNKQLLRQHDLYLGDHIELVCMSSESKPAAKLDWILNDRLNLLSAELLAKQQTYSYNQSLSSLIKVRNQRFVQMSSQYTLAQMSADDRGRLDSMKQHKLWNYYEINKETESMLNLVPLIDLKHKPSINISQSKLEQSLEISASRLKLIIDEQLIQKVFDDEIYLNQNTRINSINNSLPISKQTTNIINNSKKIFRNSNPLKNIHNLKLQLNIKCVAKYLQTKMVDELKLNLIRQTRSVAAATLDGYNSRQQKDDSTSNAQARKSKVFGNHVPNSNNSAFSEQKLINLITIVITIIVTIIEIVRQSIISDDISISIKE